MQPVDRLSSLFERFRMRTRLFHAGPLCGVTHFAAEPGRGFLHVLRRGEMTVTHHQGAAQQRIEVREPTLLFYPEPFAHTFHNAPVDGSDFVCATVDFEGGARHPLVRALPPMLALPLREVDGIEHSLALLFAETTQLRCGQRLLADRMFEVVILQLLRWILDHPAEAGVPRGLITGLAHPGIAAALTAIHEDPGQAWSLASMAGRAHMSRSAFAAQFKEYVGQTPADYLAHWRIALAQSMFRNGVPVKQAADQLGYQGAASLSRAFSQLTGLSPRAWLQSEQSDHARPADPSRNLAAPVAA